MDDPELATLERWTEGIMVRAQALGLDFYPMRFEVVPADVIYAFGAYGMPARFSHWSFGKAYHRMKTEYDYNLSRIYELVINSDPCFAFLLDGNSLLQNKLVIAHVLGHSDFFKHNYRFHGTSRYALDAMAANAERIAHYEFRYGKAQVEALLDAALALAEQVDPHPVGPPSETPKGRDGAPREDADPSAPRAPSTPYDDLWALDRLLPGGPQEKPAPERPAQRKSGDRPATRRRVPERPEKDVLRFIIDHAEALEAWERDVLAIVREEMLYFWPQMETKIMNEGWATYWHLKLMREADLDEPEALEFARMHAGVIQPQRAHVNPYLLGLKIFESIEKRWESPSAEDRERLGLPGGQGMAKLFEVRALETDASFVRNYLTQEVVEELNLFVYARHGDEWQVESTDWKQVRDTLAARLTHGGVPYILVEDGNHRNAGELMLRHSFDGQELDLVYVEKTLPYVQRLWGRPVHLATVVDGKEVLFSFDGQEHRRSDAGALAQKSAS